MEDRRNHGVAFVRKVRIVLVHRKWRPDGRRLCAASYDAAECQGQSAPPRGRPVVGFRPLPAPRRLDIASGQCLLHVVREAGGESPLCGTVFFAKLRGDGTAHAGYGDPDAAHLPELRGGDVRWRGVCPAEDQLAEISREVAEFGAHAKAPVSGGGVSPRIAAGDLAVGEFVHGQIAR